MVIFIDSDIKCQSFFRLKSSKVMGIVISLGWNLLLDKSPIEGILSPLLPPLPNKQHFQKMANLAHPCKDCSWDNMSGSVTLGHLLNWNTFNLVGILVVKLLICSVVIVCLEESQQYRHWLVNILPINHDVSNNSSCLKQLRNSEMLVYKNKHFHSTNIYWVLCQEVF